MTEMRIPGMALLCDRAGVIQKILRDEVFADGTRLLGQGYADWIDSGCHEKMSRLLDQVEADGSVFDWELNVPARGIVVTLHFSGIVQGENVLIVAAHDRDGLVQLYKNLMRMDNDFVTIPPNVIQDQIILAQTQNQNDQSIYDELSRLNNELIAAQRQLAKQNAELEILNRQKNQFLGMAAHDLRSPLSAIMTYSDFLSEEIAPLLNDEQKEFLAIIRSSSQFMRGLIEDLLDVSAIQAGHLTLNLQPTDLATLVRHNVTLNRVLASQRQHAVTLACADDLPRMNLDPAKIEQVLNNLITNAVKYAFPGTTIHVELKRDGAWVVLSVQDQGQGIPAAEMDRLFKAFSKTSVKSTTGEKSTGLGLAIVSKIIQGHAGKIWVESVVGKGSTFFVGLPVSSDRE